MIDLMLWGSILCLLVCIFKKDDRKITAEVTTAMHRRLVDLDRRDTR